MSEEYKHETFGYEFSGLSDETFKFFQEKMEKAERDMLMYKIEAAKSRQQPTDPTTWVEREVPDHLEDAAHDLITTLLKSHGYNWDGEKQDDNRPTVK